MAFGINKIELRVWKDQVRKGNISILTHYWLDERFPNCYTVTKVGCNNMERLIKWGEKYGLQAEWIHNDPVYPHFDLFGERQREILLKENQLDHIKKFNL
ncbi:hypothetical protein ACFQ3N_05590 [Virgibacillus byunsanensis]|uniref:YneQ n=1 Tax=Virgibacillus byunsanensis TaxID=570945 RepID=A0ABW3LK42_9BACI